MAACRSGSRGPLQVTAAGRAVDIGGARLRALLIRLALDAGRVVSAEALIDALWPDGTVADPGHALQSLVSRLRRALPQRELLPGGDGGYRLALSADAVDALRFEGLVAEGRRLLRGGRPTRPTPPRSPHGSSWRRSAWSGSGSRMRSSCAPR